MKEKILTILLFPVAIIAFMVGWTLICLDEWLQKRRRP